VREERRKREDEERERSREERRLQREQLKELRAKRAAERDVERSFSREVRNDGPVSIDRLHALDLLQVLEQRRSQVKSYKEDSDFEDEYNDDDQYEVERPKKRSRYTEVDSDGENASQEDDDGGGAYVPPGASGGGGIEAGDEEDDVSDEEPGGDEEEAETPLQASTNADVKSSSSRKRKRKKERRASKDQQRSNFSSALLRVGTKSTKDVQLDKPLRKTPGGLLETAGRSLLQRSASHNRPSPAGGGSLPTGGGSSLIGAGVSSAPGPSGLSGGLGFGLGASSGLLDLASASAVSSPSAKLSFGLYGGHLSVGQGGGGGKGGPSKVGVADTSAPASSAVAGGSAGSDSDGADSLGSAGGTGGYKDAPGGGPKGGGGRVFTNWGGEFFKKNLDYRANTNKILEKMNLGGGGGQSSPTTPGAPTGGVPSVASTRPSRDVNGSPSSTVSSSSLGNFVPGERFKVR